MKRAFRILPAIGAIAVGSMLVAAQDNETKREMSLIIIEKVKPSMAMQYEDATKEMCALLTAHDADPNLLGFWAVSGPEIGYVFVIPLQDGFSSMKQTHENWMVTIESIGKDRWKAIADKADACVESRAVIHTVYREDLSYTPKNPSLKQEDIDFVQYKFLYTFADKADEFEEIAKQWKALYTSKDITTGWRVYERVTGDDLPVYVVAQVAKSEVAYHTTRAAIKEQLGEAAKALGEKSDKLIRKVESKVGHPRPDLSYPTKTME